LRKIIAARRTAERYSLGLFHNIAPGGDSIYGWCVGGALCSPVNLAIEGAPVTTTMMFTRFGAFSIASLLCVCASAAGAHSATSKSQDSVAYQITPGHTGNIAFTAGFSSSLTQLWSINLNGEISYPLTAKHTAFVTVGTSGASLLVAINLSSGRVVWEKLLPGSSPWADAVYDSGNIYVVNGTGNLQAFEASHGKKLWSTQLPQGSYSTGYGAPAAGNGIVALQYNNDYSQYVGSYQAATGTNNWTIEPGYEASTDIAGVPLVEKNGIYLGAYNETGSAPFFDFSPSDGSTIWTTTLSCSSASAPVSSGQDLYVTAYSSYDDCNGGNSILSLSTGATKGAFSGSVSPAILGKTVIVSIDGVLYDYSPKSDNVYWTFSGEGELDSSPIVINGYVAALSSQNENLYLLDGSTGAQLWTTTLPYNYNCCVDGPDTGLGAGEGVLLVPYEGTLYAFAPQQGAKLGSRPEPTHVIGRMVNGRYVPN
jgi:outer membrane protein assembly factor BamB